MFHAKLFFSYTFPFTWVALLLFTLSTGRIAQSQDRPLSSAAHSATAQERLLMEQIDQLAAAGQYDEAFASLERLVDNSQGRLIELGDVQSAATLSLQIYGPISRWAQWRQAAWANAAHESLSDAIRTEEGLATRTIESAKTRHDFLSLQEAVDRFSLAPASVPARLFLSDLYLDQGWTTAARQALEAPGLSLRVPLALQAASANGSGLPWPTVWPHFRSSAQRDQQLLQTVGRITHKTSYRAEHLTAELLERLVTIAVFDTTPSEFDDTCEWASVCSERLSNEYQQQVAESIANARRWFNEREAQRKSSSRAEWYTFGGNASRSGAAIGADDIGSWPAWSRQLERITGGTDRNPASKPPVAENSLSLLPYHPVVHQGRVYIHELTRIVALNLHDGRSWPASDPPLPVFDSGMTAANYLPFGYPIMGAPRGTLTVESDTLYARMGPPVTGWYGRAPGNSGSSLSYLVALDLNRQGSMRAGFPVRLDAQQAPSAEFEGCPLVIGDQVLAAVGTRDNVNLRRWVMSVDKVTGSMQWRSPILASGTVSGSEQASLVSHQLLTAKGGRLFVNTNLGAIACIDQATGQIIWLARYRRSSPAVDQPYAKPDRYRYRDLTPCMLVGTQVICAPQDCPEIFALDLTTGELLWSTEAGSVDEATQLLGANRNSIVVAGDRIFWLERSSGRVVAAFPSGGIDDASSALPAPRGYGRGVIGDDQVFWPTQHEIFVFDADQVGRAVNGSPIIRKRMRLDTRGAEGGNLVHFKDGIIVAGANRLFVYRQMDRN